MTHPTVIVRRSPPDHGPMVLLVHVLHSSKAPRGETVGGRKRVIEGWDKIDSEAEKWI